MGQLKIRDLLGLDIGTNSVGSAWVDLDTKQIQLGVSVFPAGVDETEDARGAPKNQERRSKRSLRRSLARRSARKRHLRNLLSRYGLLPTNPDELRELFSLDPWHLRQMALNDELKNPHWFGRILLHLCQRRGALGLNLPEVDESEGEGDNKSKAKEKSEKDASDAKVKGAVEHTRKEMQKRDARTFGELIAMVSEERRMPIFDKGGRPKLGKDGQALTYGQPVRNRLDSFEFHADRNLIRDEFQKLWNVQRSFGGALSVLLTDELLHALDRPEGNMKWRHQGALFGQRRTYWNIATLGRCDLEPSDRCVPIADRHASYFRVLETVNNLRVWFPGDSAFRPLSSEEHSAVLAKLRSQKSGSIPAIRAALGIDKRTLKKHDASEADYKLNVAGDDDRELNGDWFHSAIVLGAVSENLWNSWEESRREGLNRAILKFDPQIDEDAPKLRALGINLGLGEQASDRLVAAWRTRPKLERRLKMSRRAVINLTPYMQDAFVCEKRRSDRSIEWFWLERHTFNPSKHHRPTQIESRQMFALDSMALDRSTGKPATNLQRQRYRIGGLRLSKADRHFMRKHPNLLPPAPTLANPVVRKAIHEVRRHVIAHIRAHGRKPDRIVIEFARETVKPKKLSDKIFFRNLNREKIRKKIIEEVVRPAFGDRFSQLSHNQLRAAVDRVVLCMQQRGVCAYSAVKLNPDNENGPCAYSGRPITFRMAALGSGLEVDHIIPYSRCGDNSLNNRVLCFIDSNRNKGRQTPREWWGEAFNERSGPMRFMDGHKPDKSDYFDFRDYGTKWRNFSRADVPEDWKGSQLSDTAYAAREVQNYLQQALWPTEPTHLQGGEGTRRILVTKGRYTSILRKDWQLYQKIVRGHEVTPADMQQATAKNRGDHREHAVDAVAIALTDSERIQELARRARSEEEERAKAAAQGKQLERTIKKLIPPPWGDVKSFRRQVLSQLYEKFDHLDVHDEPGVGNSPIVVSHRGVGRKLTGAFHEETLFGPVPGKDGIYTGKKKVEDLKPDHLRLPRPESRNEAIDRLADRYLQRGIESDRRKARKRAKEIVESKAYKPKLIDPPPEKTGLVRDRALRRVLRDQINQRLAALNIPRDADTFTKGDMNRIKKECPLLMPSGIPIKKVVLFRTHNDPVVIPRKAYDYQLQQKGIDPASRSPRVYVGGNNHHIEIRENAKGAWSGKIIPAFIAAQRIRVEKREAVDRSDAPEKGGRFVMSLAQGDTVLMRHKDRNEFGYFVVFKLDKPQTIQFKPHWDARRATGEKDEEGNVIRDSQREEMAVSASQLKDLAPPGEATPIKVQVDPLGRIRRIEPQPLRDDALEKLDPRIVAIAQEAISLRNNGESFSIQKGKRRRPGSWAWMGQKLRAEGLESQAVQLSAAVRALKKMANI